MKVYHLEEVKQNSDNTVFNDSIVLCDDCRSELMVLNSVLHTHDYYELQYVFSGFGVAIFKNESYALQPGSLIAIFPGDTHTYYSTDNLKIANLCLLPTDMQLHTLQNLASNVFLLNSNTQYEFESLYYLLRLSLSNANPNSDLKSEAYLTLLLDILFYASDQLKSKETRWNRLLLYLSQNYSTITLSQAAKICNRSISSFSKTFKRDFGCSFTQYIDKIKLEKAKELLSSTKRSIADISYIVGFSHPTRFYKFFRSQEGMTPHQFKNQGMSALQKKDNNI